MKKIILISFFILNMYEVKLIAQEPEMQGDLKELFKGPLSSSHYPLWLKTMQKWRIEQKKKLAYTDIIYHQQRLK